MSTMKDPYDYIEWNPDRNARLLARLDYGKEKRQRKKRTGKAAEAWIGYVYDLIALCTLAAVLATLFMLLLP